MREHYRLGALVALLLAALGVGTTAYAAVQAGSVSTTGLAADGSAMVSGWFCGAGTGMEVRLFAHGASPDGQIFLSTRSVGATVANAHCPAGLAPQRFSASVSSALLFRYGGMPIYAQPVGSAGALQEPVAGSATTNLPDWKPAVLANPRTCSISDIATLKACFAKPADYDVFAFHANVVCKTPADCTTGGKTALMSLVGQKDKVIEGNGFTLRREAGQIVAPVLQVVNSTGVLVDALNFDEDQKTQPCDLSVKNCAHTIDVTKAKNFRVDKSNIYYGKGYTVWVWDADGFVFMRSSIDNAGIIGLYVGHYKFGPTKNVVIADSIIAHSRTNGIALQGAVASVPSEPTMVIGNVFSANHWHGLWPVPGVPNGITTGGQVLLADGSDFRMVDNIVNGGHCENCNPPTQRVGAIEIGDDPPPLAGVSGISITDNNFVGGEGIVVGQNKGTSVTNMVVQDNNGSGYFKMLVINSNARTSANNLMQKRNDKNVLSFPSPAPVFGVAPVPGISPAPVLLCSSSGKSPTYWVTASLECYGATPISVLGFSVPTGSPGAQPIYGCPAAATAELTWRTACASGAPAVRLGLASSQ
jgi:hypothetical protein